MVWVQRHVHLERCKQARYKTVIVPRSTTIQIRTKPNLSQK